MRVVEASIQIRKSCYITLRMSRKYTVTLKDSHSYTGTLVNYLIDGNTLESITLDLGKVRILIRKEFIANIERA